MEIMRDMTGYVVSYGPRELEMLKYLALGFSNRQIEETMGLGKNTVRTRVTFLREKACAMNRGELIDYARTWSFVLFADDRKKAECLLAVEYLQKGTEIVRKIANEYASIVCNPELCKEFQKEPEPCL